MTKTEISRQVEILRQVDSVIAQGPFEDTWESLSAYETPAWYQDAKFGIFIHWGAYSVPAFGNEWYPRMMYKKGTAAHEHHLKTYGSLKDFGYKDFIPMFRAERFDADAWMDLIARSGARYVMPVAEHHDGFQMYDSDLSGWNARRMGPCRDVLGELKAAAERRGIVFCASSHRAEHCWFFNHGLDGDTDVRNPANLAFYGEQQEGGDHGGADVSHDINSVPPSREHCENWLARACELVDKYRPRVVWFDWWIHNVGFKPYLKKFAAYYYNRAAQWGAEVAINFKYNAFAYGTAVYDLERGQLDHINPRLWQTDTAIAKNSWGYTENNAFKRPVDIVCDLVDIVSKNGCLLLNIGPRADGTITDEETAVLLAIGEWLDRNGEGIYGTTYWQKYGEGPTQVAQGAFTDTDRPPFTPDDFRFTYKAGKLYAFAMRLPEDGVLRIPSLGETGQASRSGDFAIKDVALLGYDADVRFERDAEALHVRVSGDLRTEYPVCLRITID